MRNLIVLPFNYDHAMKVAELNWPAHREQGHQRAAVKDDFKLIAQAQCTGVQCMITEDAEMVLCCCSKLQKAGLISFETVILQDGFDRTLFDPSGQNDMLDKLPEDEDFGTEVK